MADTFVLDQRHIELIEGDVSIRLASRDAANRPSLAVGLGCHVADGSRRMTVYVATVPYRKLIEQVRETGAVAVSFQQLGTNLTVQVKGKGARVTPVDDDAFSRVTHYVERFASGVAAAGYDARLIKVGMAYLQDEISAVTFAPEAAFSQTPGPLAGGPLAGGPLAGGPLAP